MTGGLSFLDFMQLYSVYLAEINLEENREQSAHNDVAAANDRQAAYMLGELRRLFDEQNETLKKILEAVSK